MYLKVAINKIVSLSMDVGHIDESHKSLCSCDFSCSFSFYLLFATNGIKALVV